MHAKLPAALTICHYAVVRGTLAAWMPIPLMISLSHHTTPHQGQPAPQPHLQDQPSP